MTSAASGANVQEAASKLGSTVEGLGEKLGAHMAQMAYQEREQKAFDISSEYARRGQMFFQGDGTPGNPGLLQRKGNDAKTAIDDFQKWNEEQKKELTADLSPAEIRMASRLLDSTANNFFDNAVRHQAKETEAAQQASRVARIGALADSASLPGTSNENFTDAIDEAQYVARLMNPGQKKETYDALNQKTAYEFVKNFSKLNLDSDPASVQDKLEAARGMMGDAYAKELQNAIDGKMIQVDGMNLFRQYSADPDLGAQNADGSLNMQAIAKALPDDMYTPDQKKNILKIIEQENDQAARLLADKNNGASAAFFSEASKKGVTIDQQNKFAMQYAATLRDGRVDANDLRKKLEFVELVNKQMGATTDHGVYTTIHTGINEGVMGLDEINGAIKAGSLSTKSANQLTAFMQSGKSLAMRTAWKQVDANIDELLADPNERKGMKASLREQAIEGKVYSPVLLDELYKKNTATVKTGAPRHLSFIFGGRTDEYYNVAQALQENRAFVAAMGGTEPAYRLALEMGGPGVFASGSQQSIAVLELVKAGVKPSRIDKDTIKAAMDQLNARPK